MLTHFYAINYQFLCYQIILVNTSLSYWWFLDVMWWSIQWLSAHVLYCGCINFQFSYIQYFLKNVLINVHHRSTLLQHLVQTSWLWSAFFLIVFFSLSGSGYDVFLASWCVFLCRCCAPAAAHSKHAHGPWWYEPNWTPPSASSRSQHALRGYGQWWPSSPTHAEPDEWTDAW